MQRLYLCPDMYRVVLSISILSLVCGQAPNLAWVELADTVYGISSTQDTFAIFIQSRSGSIRRFDLYEGTGASRFLSGYDSVLLDASNRVSRIRRYSRPNSTAPFSLVEDLRFTYPNPPVIKIELTDGVSPTIQSEFFFYGLSIFEESFAWEFGVGGGAIPVEAYPLAYRTGQFGDSILLRSVPDDEALAIVRRGRPNACDTFLVYSGPANGPLTVIPPLNGKICHTAGRIDSMISPGSKDYWSYNANSRPIRRIRIQGSDRDTSLYTYDAAGRLIQTQESGVSSNGPYLRRYFLRYRSAPASLSMTPLSSCLAWDGSQRRGTLSCKPATTITSLWLYDLQGRLVWQATVQGHEAFEVSPTLPGGLYYLWTGEGAVPLYLLP